MKVRILTATSLAGVMLPGNSVPDLPKTLVKQLTDQGVGDSSPRAVAYAETLGVKLPDDMPSFDADGNVIDPHMPPADPAPTA
jgi:hypothetical protein